MEVTINYNGQAVAVEVTLEVYEFLDRADHKAENLFPMSSGGIGMAGSLTNTWSVSSAGRPRACKTAICTTTPLPTTTAKIL